MAWQGCDLVNLYDWDVKVAKAVCMAESGGDRLSVNWSDGHSGCIGSFGLFQIGCFWFDIYGGQWDNEADNVRVAYEIYKRTDTFTAWSAYNNGSYKEEM